MFLSFDQIDNHNASLIGGKALSLWQLKKAGFNVPKWLVIPADHSAKMCDFMEQLQQYLHEKFPKGSTFAVRSSAIGEDGSEHSFAGMFDTVLAVSIDELPQALEKVYQGLKSERALEYAKQKQLTAPLQLAIVIQRMIHADHSGVAFSQEPISQDASCVSIASIEGLGQLLVDGSESGNQYLVQFEQVIERFEQPQQHIAQSNAQQSGVQLTALDKPTLISDQQLIQIAQLTQACQAWHGKPQDIEWAIEKGQLYLLQSRPITHCPAPTEGDFLLWDNANIVESYGGVTTPLTFSFARYAYEHVYRAFCRMLLVPKSRIASNETSFKNMLGLINGQVYYNMMNWYRLLSLLPGYRFNAAFMEQMMGVKTPLPPKLQVKQLGLSQFDKVLDALHLGASFAGLIWQHWRINRTCKGFYQRLNSGILDKKPLKTASLSQLASHYRQLEQSLLHHWDAPLINDFLAMIFFGTAKGLASKWFNDDTFHHLFLTQQGDIISAQPAKMIKTIAKQVQAHPDKTQLIQALTEKSVSDIQRLLPKYPSIALQINDYLTQFSDRCLEELKLESPTLADNPISLYRAIGIYAQHSTSQQTSTLAIVAAEKAQQHYIQTTLAPFKVKKWLFMWVIKHMQQRVTGRENLRFERTRVFGHVRQVVLAMGERLVAAQKLSHKEQVFYLQIDELLAFAEGTSTLTNLADLVALRESEFAGFKQRYDQGLGPDERFFTKGAVHINNAFKAAKLNTPAVQANKSDRELAGLGASPGIVTAKVRLIDNPKEAVLQAGEILVAQRTDPGWIMLFSNAAGVIVERGSQLSHSAIVARELGIPAIVAVPNLMQQLTNGELITLNGATGEIIRHRDTPLATEHDEHTNE